MWPSSRRSNPPRPGAPAPVAATNSFLKAWSRLAPTGRGALRLVRALRGLRPGESRAGVFTTPAGLRFGLDLGVYPDCCMAFGLYELDVVRTIARLLRPGDHVIDAGANIGYISCLAALRVGPGGRVDAFEPQPDNLARLKANIAANDLGRIVRIHPLALADRAGSVTIHFYVDRQGHNHGCSTIFPDGSPTRAASVPTARMDELLRGATPRLIKIDVEGAEPLVVDGMERLLRVDRPPAVIIEHNPASARAAGFPADEALRRILRVQPRYRMALIGWQLRPVSLVDLRGVGEANLLLRA